MKMEQQTNQTTYQNKEIEDLIESEYEKSILENESRTYEFLAGKEKVVEKPDFNGKLTKKVQFVVVRPNDSSRKEKKFELSRIHVGKIYEQLKKGLTVLEISRTGKGKDTRYTVKPIAKT
jgi:hypothetical protein